MSRWRPENLYPNYRPNLPRCVAPFGDSSALHSPEDAHEREVSIEFGAKIGPNVTEGVVMTGEVWSAFAR